MNTDDIYKFHVIIDNVAHFGNLTISDENGNILRNFVSDFSEDLTLKYYGIVVGRNEDGILSCVDDFTISKENGKRHITFNDMTP